MGEEVYQKEEIGDLWAIYLKSKSEKYRDALILNYLHLVKYVVGKLGASLPSHIKLDDLYSSGITGLIKAIERYDNTKNSKFESYAILLIKGAMIDELRALDWVPRSVHQKAHVVANAQHYLQQKFGREPTDLELSMHLGITEVDLEELLQRIRPIMLISLNSEVSLGDNESCSLLDKIADSKAKTSYDIANRRECISHLEHAIAHLPEQERKVLTLYYYEDLILREIGNILGVSESRVSQIHTKALLKLRCKLASLRNEMI